MVYEKSCLGCLNLEERDGESVCVAYEMPIRLINEAECQEWNYSEQK
jgi:hypothetical protein